MKDVSAFTLYVLGGCGEFGRNCTLLHQGNASIVVDCGSQFPDDETFDIACLVPHPQIWKYLPAPSAYVLTHGHEDHIGALQHVLPHAPAPVYGTRFTLRLLSERVAQLPPAIRQKSPLIEIVPGKQQELPGGIPCTPVAVTHSIPQSLALVLEFPAGPVIHTGDFKLAPQAHWNHDFPPSETSKVDFLQAIQQYLKQEPFLLLVDSTGAYTQLESPSEETLAPSIEELMTQTHGRLFVTLFSSHIERARHFLRIGAMLGRKAAAVGPSMERYLNTARQEGLLPEANLTTLENVMALPVHQQMFLIAGSQGETASALERFSAENHPLVQPQSTDTVVFSSSVIPGRERFVGRIFDRLAAAKVRTLWHTDDMPTHVSGHGSKEELLRVFLQLHPRSIIPLHGSIRYLTAASQIALQAGIQNTLVVPDGFRAIWNNNHWYQEKWPIDIVLRLENPALTPLSEESLRLRKKIAITGVVFVSVQILRNHHVDLKITIVGIGDEQQHSRWERDLKTTVLHALSDYNEHPEQTVEFAVKHFFKSETGKKPQVVVHWLSER